MKVVKVPFESSSISKRQTIQTSLILHLATKIQTGELDDLAVSNNSDTEKVLATVVSALYAFFDKHPEAFVYATGSTLARTRLYRLGISKYFEELAADFQLYGQIGDDF